MPGKVGVKIKAGRNLPVMDRGSDTTDAYVEIKLGNVTHKTDVCRKSLNPQWNTDWFRFEVDDAELQDEPLQIRLMDHDTYSANDAIGKVYISLNPLCLETASQSNQGKGAVMSGWIPVFDTMHGIRGEVNVIVKVDLFSDANKFRQSSCGIQFFHSSSVPHGYKAQIIHGFVEELVVNDDPEYQWIDKIRTPRASNEARQVVFLKLSGQVQRKIGLKAINLGANAVIGYTQCFDLEGDVGVVARGIGTAVTLVKIQDPERTPSVDNALIEESELTASSVAVTSAIAIATAATTTVTSSVTSTAANSITNVVGSCASPKSSGTNAVNVIIGKSIVAASTITTNPRTDSVVTGNNANSGSSNGSCKLSQSPAKIGNSASITGSTTTTNKEKDKDTGIYRRSSDSDLSVTPKGNSLCIASERLITATTLMRTSAKIPTQENLDMLEYPFLTMTKYPQGFILHLGATVAARSVKLLERVPNPDEPETRDSWWTELRMEIRSHARALSCNVILGYSEETTISDDVCVLSSTGTAAVINMSYNGDASQTFDLTSCLKRDIIMSSLDDREGLKDSKTIVIRNIDDQQNSSISGTKELSSSFSGITTQTQTQMATTGVLTKPSFIFNYGCSMCHIPYSQSSVPFNVKMKKCAICKRGKVPDVLLATIEIPECLQITGRGCFMQAQVMRSKKDLRSESNAKEISDGLPFLEYELHRLLINKLKAKGMNAIFGLKVQVAVGEKMMALIATGTAIYLTALPPPSVPKIVAGNSWTDMAKLKELQKSLQETVEKNREIYQLKCLDPDLQYQQQNGKQSSDTDDSDDDVIPELDLTTGGNKDTCVLEVDDIEDLEIISLLMEPCPPEGFHVVNTQTVPSLHDLEVVRNLRMFTQIWRAKLCIGQSSGNLPKHFQRLLQTIFFKLRTMIPCAVCDLRFKLDLPESDEIQVLVTGMALGLGELSKFSKIRRKTLSGITNDNQTSQQIQQQQHISNGLINTNINKKLQDDELIFSLDEDQVLIEQSSLPTNQQQQSSSNTTITTTSTTSTTSSTLNSNNFGSHSLRLRKGSPSRPKYDAVKFSKHMPLRERYGVDITPLSYVPGGRIEKYLGNLNFFFIRESTSVRENGGISGFVHSFITELLGVVRAHVLALGGNAMVSFYMTELLLVDNQHKNQGQCLISIGGDVVHVSYFTDD